MATLTADKPKDAIAALLQERQRYEQWLAALDARRAATPPNVYTRVRSDYEGRLARVIEELGGRTAELQQVVDTLSSQVASLQDEESAKRDLQAEAELRAAVGEYSPEQWREVNQTSQVELARLAGLKADAASELAQIQQLLNMATTRRAGGASSAAPSAVAPPAAAAPRPARPGEPVTGGRTAPRAAEPATGPSRAPRADRGGESATFDELAFLHSVVEPKPGAGGPATRQPGEPPTRPPVVPPPPAPIAPATAPRPAVQPPSAPPPAPAPAVAKAPPAPAPVATAPTVTPPEAALINTTTSAPTAESPRRRMEDSQAVPVFLRDVPSEQVKTLKCAECGTMNYPTEWYCERCGGELAAM
jgi:hypothetical protein